MKLKRILKWSAATIALALVVAGLIAYWSSTNDCDHEIPVPTHPMKAVVHCDYGSPDVLSVQDVEKPAPDDNQVLIRVRAASINPLEWHYMRGTPYFGRIEMGLRKPKSIRLGVDFAGTVEAVGKNVTQFKPGDDVFGARSGALAEYVSVFQDRALVPKPSNVTFEQAAYLLRQSPRCRLFATKERFSPARGF